jgi:hypothetical protein
MSHKCKTGREQTQQLRGKAELFDHLVGADEQRCWHI